MLKELHTHTHSTRIAHARVFSPSSGRMCACEQCSCWRWLCYIMLRFVLNKRLYHRLNIIHLASAHITQLLLSMGLVRAIHTVFIRAHTSTTHDLAMDE